MQPEIAPSSQLEREALAGLVERVTYYNPENGVCGLRVKVRGQREVGRASQVPRASAA